MTAAVCVVLRACVPNAAKSIWLCRNISEKEKTPDGGNRQTLIGKYPFTTMKIPACSYYITTAEQVQVQNAHTKNNLIYYREKI